MRARLTAVVCLTVALSGCSTLGGRVQTSFSESVTDPGDETTVTTSYSAESRAGLFGKLETTNHQFRYDWEGNSIQSGQNALGIDNSGNKIMLDAMTALLKDLIQQVSTLQAQQMSIRSAIAAAQRETPAQSAPLLQALSKLLGNSPSCPACGE